MRALSLGKSLKFAGKKIEFFLTEEKNTPRFICRCAGMEITTPRHPNAS